MDIQSSLNKFSGELDEWYKDQTETILLAVEQVAQSVHAEVVSRTRIRTGRAKSNWHVALGGPNFEVDPSILDEDVTTWISAAEAEVRARQSWSVLDGLTMRSPNIYISNGVYYIVVLESKDFMAEGTAQWATTFLPVTLIGGVEKG